MLEEEKKDLESKLGESRYKVIERIDGPVWYAYDKQLERYCAVKQAEESSRTLKKEARAMAKIDSPYVVKIYELKEISGFEHLLIMEFLDGMTLKKRIKENLKSDTKRSIEESVDILTQVCYGLDEMHKVGLKHRDINPNNIMVTEKTVKICDLGSVQKIERKTTSNVFGTAHYVPPEQAPLKGEGKKPKTYFSSDIFSVGVVFYEMLSRGKLPFDSKYSEEIQELKRDKDYVDDLQIEGIDENIMDIIKKCLQPNHKDRYQSIPELLSDLKKIGIKLPKIEPATPPKPRPHKPELTQADEKQIQSLCSTINKELKKARSKYNVTEDPETIRTVLEQQYQLHGYIAKYSISDNLLNKIKGSDKKIKQKYDIDVKAVEEFLDKNKPDKEKSSHYKEIVKAWGHGILVYSKRESMEGGYPDAKKLKTIDHLINLAKVKENIEEIFGDTATIRYHEEKAKQIRQNKKNAT